MTTMLLCAACRELMRRDEMVTDEDGVYWCKAHAPKVKRGKR